MTIQAYKNKNELKLKFKLLNLSFIFMFLNFMLFQSYANLSNFNTQISNSFQSLNTLTNSAIQSGIYGTDFKDSLISNITTQTSDYFSNNYNLVYLNFALLYRSKFALKF